ncbi:ice nucleation protein [Phlyctema vagabunda]|uniref:Crh-like protein n=1 Tax=Phlyctema vagabunda TaxID=108571 RepID=A0ABR4PCV0_9HELO
MRTSTLSLAAWAMAASQLVGAQTFTDCNPTEKTCPSDPALGTTISVDFTAGEDAVLEHFTYADGTTLTYDDENGGSFSIAKAGNAPTISSKKFIFFGKVDVVMRASPGSGIVSSFVLQSDTLDEIDWEFLGGTPETVQTNFFGKGNTTTYDRQITVAAAANQNEFHKYTVEWTSESIQWKVDDVTLRTLLYNDATTVGGKNYPQTPMMIKMGNWIGCADAAAAADPATKGTCEWIGGYADFTKAPFVQYVKSITIQDYGCAESYSYGDLSGSFESIVSDGSCDGSSNSGSTTTGSISKTTASIKTSSLGGVFAESSTGTVTATGTSTAAATSGASTTLTTTSTGSSASGTSASATTSSTLAQNSANAAAGKPKHQYGAIEYGVMALGLGLGYLVM